MRNKTVWDVYYWLQFELEQTGRKPSLESVLDKFREYDRELIDRGLRLFNENYKEGGQ